MTVYLTINGVAVGPLTRTHRGEYEVRLPDYTTLAASDLDDLRRRVNEHYLNQEELRMSP